MLASTPMFAVSFPRRSVRLKNVSFPCGQLIGQPYGSVWEAIGKGITRVEDGVLNPTLGNFDPVGADTDEVNAADNRNLVDTGTAQSLNQASISDMKAAGQSGTDIVTALVAGSATFASKTAFSQEKYLKKKTAKYVKRFRVVRCTAQSITDTVMESNYEKICGLRSDSLATMLTHSNVRAGCTAMVFDGVAGLLAGAVAERMVSPTTSAASASSSSSSSSTGGSIILPHEDTRRAGGPNLYYFHRFNLAYDEPVRRMLVGLKYSELSGWGSRVKAYGDAAATSSGASEPAPAASSSAVGQKRGRDEDGDGSASSVSQRQQPPKVATDATGKATWSAGGNKGKHNAAAGGTQTFRPSASSSSSQHGFNPEQLTPWPHQDQERLGILAGGVDSLLVAVPGDPQPLVLAALRYMKPCSSFCVFSQDLACLSALFRRLKDLGCGMCLSLSEPWTREHQVLPNRTHPNMSMHGCPGYTLSGTILASPFCALPMAITDSEQQAADQRSIAEAQSSAALAASSSAAAGNAAATVPLTAAQQRAIDIGHMRLACAEAALCEPVSTAYNVGAVLVDASGSRVLSRGRSRELPGNTHAEEVCLMKTGAIQGEDGAAAPPTADTAGGRGSGAWVGGCMYTTMEPCSKRLSGKGSCTDLIIAARVGRVVLAITEPPTFVVCEGIARLRGAGIEVVMLEDETCARLAREANKHIAGLQ